MTYMLSFRAIADHLGTRALTEVDPLLHDTMTLYLTGMIKKRRYGNSGLNSVLSGIVASPFQT